MALNIEQRLGQKLTNEQQLLWNYLLSRWPNLKFAEYFYQGNVAGELTVYSATKLYIAYELDLPASTSISSTASAPSITLYNESDSARYILANNAAYWDATAAAVRFLSNGRMLKNLYFSRIALNIVTQVKFIGYRLTI